MTAPRAVALSLVRDTFAADTLAGNGYTLGLLLIDGAVFGSVCEDTDRGLEQSMTLDELRERKIKGRTAIPTGTYRLGVRYSPKHKTEVIWLTDVPGYQWIEIHAGNTSADTDGCLLPGLHRSATGVLDSRKAMAWLDQHVLPRVRMYGGTITVSRAATSGGRA